MIRLTSALLIGLLVVGFAVAAPVTASGAEDTGVAKTAEKLLTKGKFPNAATTTPTPLKTTVTTTKVSATTKIPTTTKTVAATKTPTKVSTPVPTVTKVSYKTYTAETFSVGYPSSWQSSKQSDTDLDIFRFDSGKQKNAFIVLASKNRELGTLDEETDIYQNFVSGTQQNFKVLSKESTTVSGMPAKKIIATGTADTIPIKSNLVVTVSGGRAYLFWFYDQESAFSGDEPMIGEIMKSVKIVVQPVTPVPTKTPAPMKSFQDSEKRFSLLYPGDWISQQSTSDKYIDVYSFNEPGNEAKFTSVVTKNQIVSSLDLRWKNELDYAKKNHPGYKLIESGDTKLGGFPAKKAVYTWTQDKVPVKDIMIMTVTGNREYSLTFTTSEKGYETYKPTFEKTISSFAVTAKPLPDPTATPTPTPTPTKVTYETYTDSRISVQYPGNWVKTLEDTNPVTNMLIFSSPSSPSTMGVMILKTGKPDDLVNLSKGWFENSPWKEGKKTDTKLSGLKAIRYEFTGSINGKPMVGVVTVTKTDKGAYWVYFTSEKASYATDLPEYEKMLKSFKAKY